MARLTELEKKKIHPLKFRYIEFMLIDISKRLYEIPEGKVIDTIALEWSKITQVEPVKVTKEEIIRKLVFTCIYLTDKMVATNAITQVLITSKRVRRKDEPFTTEKDPEFIVIKLLMCLSMCNFESMYENFLELDHKKITRIYDHSLSIFNNFFMEKVATSHKIKLYNKK